jgi:hypothetical protein
MAIALSATPDDQERSWQRGSVVNALSGTKRMLLSGMESAHLEATVRSESQSQVLSNYWPELRESIPGFNARRQPPTDDSYR